MRGAVIARSKATKQPPSLRAQRSNLRHCEGQSPEANCPAPQARPRLHACTTSATADLRHWPEGMPLGLTTDALLARLLRRFAPRNDESGLARDKSLRGAKPRNNLCHCDASVIASAAKQALQRRMSQVGRSRRCASMEARPSLRQAPRDCFAALAMTQKCKARNDGGCFT